MVLAATVVAAADFDVQILHGLIELGARFGHFLAQLGGETARGRNSELAGVGSGASDDVDDGSGAGRGEFHGFERLVEFRQVA